MRNDVPESELQEYLDGRMSEARRRAFEQRVAADADLARRVRAYRASGDALRRGSETLSPDFYARLRIRFEQSRNPRPGWFRLASWETAGLAAAVLIAVVLFVPFVLERPTGPAAPALSTEPAKSPIAPRQTAAADAEKTAVTKKKDDTSDALSESRIESESLAKTPSTGPLGQAGPSPAAPVDERKNEEQAQLRADEGRLASPAPSSASGSREATQGDAPARARDSVSPAAPEPDADQAGGDRPAKFRRQAVRPTSGLADERGPGEEIAPAHPVPASAIEPGTWRRIDTAEAWSELAQAAALGSYDPGRQVILIGDRDGGLDCSGSVVRETSEAHEIRLALLAPGAPRDGHGCAFVLPRDGRPVLVLGPGEQP